MSSQPTDDNCEPVSITYRLMQASSGHPNAKIPWPHRLLHDAKDEIEALQARIPELEADQRRLEWLVANAPSYHGFIYDLLRGCGDNWRDAIDEAMREGGE